MKKQNYRKIVMIGKQYDTVLLEIAKEYSFACDEILLVSRYRNTMSNYKDAKISYVPTIEHESFLFRLCLIGLVRILKIILFPYRLISNNKSVYGLIDPIIQAISVSNYVNKLNNVYFVSAHSIFTFGLAGIFCKKHLRILRPWGGDVYQLAFYSKLHYAFIKYLLQKADLIDASTPTLFNYLKNEFGVCENLVLNEATTYMGAKEVEFIKHKYTKQQVRKELGLPLDKTIIVNCRRFKEKWGAVEVFNAFLGLAKKYDNLHFILLSGVNAEDKIAQTKLELENYGLLQKFTIYEKNVDLEMYVKVIYSSDVFFSLMHKADLRSASIISGMHCESLPILSDMPEYREMMSEGARFQIVPFNDNTKVITACENYLFRKNLREETIIANNQYISKKITMDSPYTVLLKRVDELIAKHNNNCN